MLTTEFSSVSDIRTQFSNQMECVAYLETLRWGGDVISPFDAFSKVYVCRNFRYRCRNTGKYFNVRTNTLFHNSKIDLQKWLIALWLVINSPAITSIALGKELGITQKTAWLMIQRIYKYAVLEPRVKNRIDTNNIEVVIDSDKLKMTDWFRQL